MKTDRELLELAAKAAGYTTAHKWNAKRMLLNPPVVALVVHRDGELVTTGWNPLANDGDALRLAVKWGFSIDLQYGEEERMTLVSTWNGLMFSEYHGSSNPNAATRRAIVRAAAAMGEAMP